MWRLAQMREMRWMLQLEHWADGMQAMLLAQSPGVCWVRRGWQCDQGWLDWVLGRAQRLGRLLQAGALQHDLGLVQQQHGHPPVCWAVGPAPAPREPPVQLAQEHAAGRPAAQGQQQVLAEVLPGAQLACAAQGPALGADAGLLGRCSAG